MNCALSSPDASLPDIPGGQILTIKSALMIGACLIALSGCGTAKTVLQADEDATRSLRKHKTYCQSIPRLYSGLAYNFCILNAPPDPTGFLVPYALLDITLSGVMDTVALPYTIYRQVAHGNLSIYWRTTR